MDRWYFLDDDSSSGPENMARDEFLFHRAKREGGPPFLRFYSFEPPAVTIGYHQDAARVLELDSLRRDGIDVVRRITGGRALLHAGELTYCIVVSQSHRLYRGGLHETYLAIARGLEAALRNLGIDASISNGRWERKGHGLSPPCLVSVSRHEITARGKKIVCSAQRRTRGAILQHGSILLESGSEEIVTYAKGDWGLLRERMTSISVEIGRKVSREEVKASLLEAFAGCFGAAWMPLTFSASDEREIENLAMKKRDEFSFLCSEEVACRC